MQGQAEKSDLTHDPTIGLTRGTHQCIPPGSAAIPVSTCSCTPLSLHPRRTHGLDPVSEAQTHMADLGPPHGRRLRWLFELLGHLALGHSESVLGGDVHEGIDDGVEVELPLVIDKDAHVHHRMRKPFRSKLLVTKDVEEVACFANVQKLSARTHSTYTQRGREGAQDERMGGVASV